MEKLWGLKLPYGIDSYSEFTGTERIKPATVT